MTRLTIIPNVEKKRLTFDGSIASGEHVELRVYDFADKIEEGRLRVRAVDFQGNTLAVFPVKARDENGDVEKDENGNDVWEQWGIDEDYEYATCVFNLNTIPALKYFRRGGECLIVLDDPESKTLYGRGHLCVLPWPKEIGNDEPVDLDSYPGNIRDFVRRLDDAEDNVENCRRDVEFALSFASNANANANTAVSTAQDAMAESSEAKTDARNALEDSVAAKKAAQDAECLVSAAQNAAQAAQDAVGNLAEVARSGSYNNLSDKPQIPSIAGLAKKEEVDHVENVLRGELNGEISRAKKAEEDLGVAVGAKAESTALASEIQRAEAAENDLRARIAALKSFDVRVVNALPATGLANTVYLVPSANSSDRNVKDEYLWINGAWEQIGSTALDLTGYAKKSEVPTRFVRDAAASSDGKTLTLTKNDGSVVSFQGGSSGAVESVNGQTGAVVLTGSDIATSAEDGRTVAEQLAAKADEFTPWEQTYGPSSHADVRRNGEGWGVWSGAAGRFTTTVVKGDENSTSLSWSEDETEDGLTLSYARRRVLRTGDAATPEQLAEKADEFTPWVFGGDESEDVSYSMSRVSSPIDGWKLTGSDGTAYYGEGTDESVSVDFIFSTGQANKTITATRKRVLRTGDADKLTPDQKDLLGGGPYLPLSGGTMADGAKINLNSLGASIGAGPTDGTVYIEARGSGESEIPASGGVILRARSVKKNDEELATEAQVNAVSGKVDAIRETMSTDSRLLVGGSYSAPPDAGSPTTAAIQTRTDETAEWTNEIRVDKGYDAVQGSTMVKLDKSVQTVTVAGGSLTIELPNTAGGTVGDLCLYVNNTSPTETVTMTFPAGVTVYKTKGGDDPKAAAQAGGITAYYFTEIPGGAWRVMRDELEVVA